MVVRGHLVRARLRRMKNAAVKIQACVRGFLAWKKYEDAKRAALVLQLRFRAWLLGRAVARNYNALKSAALIIQSSYRQYKTRRQLKRNRAATKIQCTFRRYACRSKFLAQKSSVVIVQTAVRRYLVRRFYLNLRSTVILTQRRFRAQQEMQKARQHYTAQRKACISLQAGLRGWFCIRQYNAIRAAAIIIQERRRACMKSRKQRREFLQLKNAVIILQSYWRMFSARSKYEKSRNAVVKTQAVVRMRNAAMLYKKLKRITSALQERYRANQLCKAQRRRYEAMRQSAIVIQSHFRGFQARQRVAKVVEEKLRRQAAAMKIQRYYRGYRLMEETHFAYHVTRGAIITMQSACRMYAARKFVRKLRAVVKLQAIYRGTVQRRKFLIVRETMCRLQAAVRRNQALKRYERMQKAIVAVQQWYRALRAMKKSYEEYHCLRNATVMIQSHFRRHRQRLAYLRERQQVILAQSVARMRLERTRFLRKRSATIVIQRRYRSYIFGKAVCQRYQLMRSAATAIQVPGVNVFCPVLTFDFVRNISVGRKFVGFGTGYPQGKMFW